MKKTTLVLATVMVSQVAMAQFKEGTGATSVSIAGNSAPFSEGTGQVVLSKSQIATLAAYADNSRALLVNALRDASGMNLKQANSVYAKAIIKVIINSYNQEGAKELLMRHVLNQALEMTIGVPDVKGKLSGGILRNTVNQDLITIVFEDSIKLAIELYQDDRACIQSGSMAHQPIMRTAITRLALAQKWNLSVVEQEVSLEFQKMALQQFVNTAAVKSNLYLAAFAEEIKTAYDKVQELNGETVASLEADGTLMQNVRLLRRTTDEVLNDAQRKVNSGVFNR